MRIKFVFLPAITLTLLLFAFAVLLIMPRDLCAGPPLLCHPVEIGNAKSLPWGKGAFGLMTNYDRERLIDDTLELLSPDMPVIVRMETLRRATLYASRNLEGAHRGKSYTEQDRRIAFELLSRLMARALNGDANGTSSAMAWFDAGYLHQCYEQAHLVEGFVGYNWAIKALSLRGEDPEIEFAGALMTIEPARERHQEHLRKAVAAARQGSLLATNLIIHFGKNAKAL